MTDPVDTAECTRPAASSAGGDRFPLDGHPRLRLFISVLLALHLLAIVSAPWAMQPSSLLAQRVFRFFQPYLDAAYLNHGYHFFAPEPGPCHTIRFELTFADGSRAEGVFPDREAHTPRLLYHRHFMLTESAGRLALDEQTQSQLDALSRSFAAHLLTQTGAVQVRLFLRRRYIPSPEQVASGMELTAVELLAERSLGTFETLPPESSSTEAAQRIARHNQRAGVF